MNRLQGMAKVGVGGGPNGPLDGARRGAIDERPDRARTGKSGGQGAWLMGEALAAGVVGEIAEAGNELCELGGGAGEGLDIAGDLGYLGGDFLDAGGDLFAGGGGLLGDGGGVGDGGADSFGGGGHFGCAFGGIAGELGNAFDDGSERFDAGFDAGGGGADAFDFLADGCGGLDDAAEGCAGAFGAGSAFFDVGDRGFHGTDGALCTVLDACDESGDFFGRDGRPFGEGADVFGDDGEAATLFAGSGGFDGGVECEEVGLGGDVVDDLDDGADLGALASEVFDLLGGLADGFADGCHGFDGLLDGFGAFAGLGDGGIATLGGGGGGFAGPVEGGANGFGGADCVLEGRRLLGGCPRNGGAGGGERVDLLVEG